MSYDPAYQRAYYLARREALCRQQRDLYDQDRDTQRKRVWVHHNRQRYAAYQAAYYQSQKERPTMTGPEAKALRESTELDRVTWAALLGITPQAVGNVETGGRPAGRVLEQSWKMTAKNRKKRRKKTDIP